MTKKRTGREREGRFRGIRDLIGNKRVEEAVKGSEEHWRSLVKNIPDIIMTVDADGTIRFINRTVPGFATERVIGTSVYDYVPQEHHDTLRKFLEGIFETGEAHDFEVAGAGPFGRASWYFNRIGPVVRDGRVVAATLIATDITERKRAEEALRESEERYRDLVENINEAVYQLDTTGRITYISPIIEEVGGYSPSEVVGRPFADFLHPDDLSRAVEGFQRGISGHPRPNEYRLLSKAGEAFWVRSFGRPIFEGGRIVGVRGVLTDITERKLAEEALRESEERYRDLAENLNDAIFEFDTSGRMTYCSTGMEEVSGYSSSEMIGRSFVEFVCPDDLASVTEAIRQRAFGNREPSEYRFLTKSGEERWVRSLGSPMFEGDRVVGFRAVLMDINEHKLADEALRKSRERYRELVENINEIIYELDAGGRMTYVSPVVEQVFGYRPSEVVGRPFADFLHPDDLSRAVEGLQRSVSGAHEPAEYRFFSKSGEVQWVRLFGRPMRDGDRVVGVRGVLTEITQRKQAEEALRESEAKFRTLAETTPAATFISQGTRLRYINSAMEAITGYSREELLAMDFWETAHPDHRELLRERGLARQQGKQVPSRYEIKILTKSGQERWLDVAVDVIDFEGSPAVMGTAFDITERKQAEEALKESEERHRSLFETVSEGIIVHENGVILDANPAYAQMFGYALSELIGMSAFDLAAKESHDLIREKIDSGSEDPYEAVGLRKDGTTCDVEVFGKGFTYKGRPVRVAAFRDITERKRAEEALRESEERYRTLVEAAPDVIYALSRDGAITSLNSAFESLSGWSRDEWLGKHFAPIIHPDDLPAAMDDFRLVLRGEIPPVGEYRMLTKSGQYLMAETVARPLMADGRVVGTFGIARDISERKRMEETLQRAREELESTVERQMQQGTLYGLTFRELTVLHLVADGRSDKEIGTVLGISTQTAHKHVASILSKMSVASRTKASVRAVREGLLD